jgi:hypothetical protein
MSQKLEIKLSIPKDTKAFTVLHMYNSYAKALLEQNPTYWSKRNNITTYAIIYCMVGDKPIELISYKLFRKAIEVYFTKAREAICDGHVVNLGSCMGRIAANRIENNLKMQATKRRIDWLKTMKNPINENTGRRNAVYKEVQETYCRIGWEKVVTLRNANVMEFKPTTSNTGMNDPDHMGFANQFAMNLLANPNIQLTYRYFPIK